MSLTYLQRLLCISLAACFLAHLAIGAVVSLMVRPALRLGDRIPPRVWRRAACWPCACCLRQAPHLSG